MAAATTVARKTTAGPKTTGASGKRARTAHGNPTGGTESSGASGKTAGSECAGTHCPRSRKSGRPGIESAERRTRTGAMKALTRMKLVKATIVTEVAEMAMPVMIDVSEWVVPPPRIRVPVPPIIEIGRAHV